MLYNTAETIETATTRAINDPTNSYFGYDSCFVAFFGVFAVFDRFFVFILSRDIEYAVYVFNCLNTVSLTCGLGALHMCL